MVAPASEFVKLIIRSHPSDFNFAPRDYCHLRIDDARIGETCAESVQNQCHALRCIGLPRYTRRAGRRRFLNGAFPEARPWASWFKLTARRLKQP